MPLAEMIQKANQNRNKLNHMTLKPGQERWQYKRMLKAAEEFDRIVTGDAWVKFWNRKNVMRAIDRGDVLMVEYWLMSKLWMVQFRQGIGVENG
ncbi:MAG: hypothetical protein U9R53_10910 [Chloroflexota bacterium]|nr:hypothetical protein [Chloroflexota bacterium]